MSLSDSVLFLDQVGDLRCPQGHALRSFQTKDLDEPSMSTYLVHGNRLYLAEPADAGSRSEGDVESWHVEGNEAVRQHRFKLREVREPLTLDVYGSCNACDPVLVRTDQPNVFGDIVNEHAVFVDFRLTFGLEDSMQVERTSGTRDELKDDLRARGVYVLADDDPLAVAHREIKKARERQDPRDSRRRRWR